METLLKLCYGNHPKSKELKKLGKKCLLLLARRGEMEVVELCKELGIKTERWKGYEKPSKKFYNVVNPLKEIQIISSVKRREGKKFKTIYYFTPEKFEGYMKAFVRTTLEYLSKKRKHKI
jgi:hypothetical protein